MAVAALLLFGLLLLVTFGRARGGPRDELLSELEARRARRVGGWLGLLVPLGLGALAGLLSFVDPWFQLTAGGGLALAAIGLPLGRLVIPVVLRHRTLPPFPLVLGWALATGAAVALGFGVIAVASGTSSPFVILYALSWTPVYTISATLPAVVIWALLLGWIRERTVMPGVAASGR